MKKWINSCIVWLSVVLATGAAEPGTVLKDRCNLRSRPSTKAEVITQLKKGDAIEVVERKSVDEAGKSREWLRVTLPAAAKCYVSAKLLTDGAANTDSVNIRSGPGTHYHEVGKLAKGDKVEVAGKKGEWTEIKPTANCSGWIAAELVQVEAAPAPAAAPPAPPAPAVSPEKSEVVTPPVAAPAVKTVDTDPDVITRYVMRDGVLRPVANAAGAPASYELITKEVDRLEHRICYVDVQTLSVEQLAGRFVKVFGNERWRKGDRYAVLTADRIDRIW